MKNKISLLSEETIIQIAAGEIIENPASVIKELVENSIDANSKRISIEIKNNGRDLIKVTDDGYGFSKEDLKIAFKRHTTSKIRNIEELKTALSLGFRGEALSSIANVSNVTIITKREDDFIGIIAKLDYNGDIMSMEEIVTNNGTTIICENLFENIPVRKKYLEIKNYEIQKTTDIINRLALSHPNVSIEYNKDGRTMIKTDRSATLINNIYSVLGKEVSENLNYVEFKSNDYNFHGYISNNHLFRSNKNAQYLFVNNRSVIDKDLSRIIEKQYQSVIPLNRYPVFIIYLDILPELLDINIHPKKDIIKFTNIDELEVSFSKIVNDRLHSNLNVLGYKSVERDKGSPSIFEIYKDNESKVEIIEEINDVNEDVITFKDFSEEYSIDIELKKEEFESEHFLEEPNKFQLLENGYRYIGSFLNQYLLLEDNVDKSLYFLDQHGAHERINYERLVRDYNDGKIPIQNLISGYMIDLTRSEFELIIELQSKLKDIGIEIEEFGDNSIIIRSIPAYIENLNPESLIRDIIDNSDFNTSIYDINPYELMKKACRASIKSGESIRNVEVHQLIEDLRSSDFPLTCPHGRPTIVKITKDELDKKFYRIQSNG